jgi:hypothetical protein
MVVNTRFYPATSGLFGFSYLVVLGNVAIDENARASCAGTTRIRGSTLEIVLILAIPSFTSPSFSPMSHRMSHGFTAGMSIPSSCHTKSPMKTKRRPEGSPTKIATESGVWPPTGITTTDPSPKTSWQSIDDVSRSGRQRDKFLRASHQALRIRCARLAATGSLRARHLYSANENSSKDRAVTP